MEAVIEILGVISGFVWGPVMLVFLIGTGIYLTVGLKGYTFRHIPTAFRMLGSGYERDATKGEISAFGALMTAMAGTVGTGSIVGVATALMAGGPGALFWMWCTAFVGMATKFSEIVLAMYFRETSPGGNVVGGAMYYIKNGLGPKWVWLGTLFAIFTGLACFGIGNMVQSNAIAGILTQSLNIPSWVTAAVLFVVVGLVILGGVRRIGYVAARVVPTMVIVYIVAALFVVISHYDLVIPTLQMVVHDAFNPASAVGGFAGASVMMAIRFGMARGVFANEAGLGSAPIAHATATSSPIRQGTLGMLEVFITTFFICTMTGLTILITGQWCAEGAQGASVTAFAFESAMPGIGRYIVTFALALFAFTTILGWCVYGERAWMYLCGDKALKPFRVFYTIIVPIGALVQIDFVWLFADVMNGLMALPNLIALVLLSPVVFKIVREGEKNKFWLHDKEAQSSE